MRVIPPVTITDAMLVSSSVVETPPAAYAGGTTYAAGVNVSTGTIGGVITVWKSLAGSNLGNTPSSSPTWWQNIGTTYAVYDSTHTYALGDVVIDPVAHLVYESELAGNLNHTPGTGTEWLKTGVTNYWAAFDQLRNTQTVAPVDIVQSIFSADRISSIAVIGLDARWVTITVTVGGVVKYTITVDLNTRKSRTWKEFYTKKFTSRKSVQFYNLPPFRNVTITVTTKKTNGQRGVGGILIGNAVYMGAVQYEATSDHLNFSTIDRDKAGNVMLDPERSVPKVDATIFFDKSMTQQLLELREELNGRPAVWSGLDDFTDDYFEPLFVYGPHKEFSLNLKYPEHGIATLQVEEM